MADGAVDGGVAVGQRDESEVDGAVAVVAVGEYDGCVGDGGAEADACEGVGEEGFFYAACYDGVAGRVDGEHQCAVVVSAVADVGTWFGDGCVEEGIALSLADGGGYGVGHVAGVPDEERFGDGVGAAAPERGDEGYGVSAWDKGAVERRGVADAVAVDEPVNEVAGVGCELRVCGIEAYDAGVVERQGQVAFGAVGTVECECSDRIALAGYCNELERAA